MTASTLSSTAVSLGDDLRPRQADVGLDAPGFFRAWSSSFLVYFFPNVVGRLWTRVSLARAVVVAILNLAIAPLWIVLVVGSYEALDRAMLRVSLVGDYVADPFGRFVGVLKSVPGQFYELWNDRTMFSAFEHFVMLGAAAFVFFTGLAILFFVLLPLAARPGPNKPCVKHTFARCF